MVLRSLPNVQVALCISGLYQCICSALFDAHGDLLLYTIPHPTGEHALSIPKGATSYEKLLLLQSVHSLGALVLVGLLGAGLRASLHCENIL